MRRHVGAWSLLLIALGEKLHASLALDQSLNCLANTPFDEDQSTKHTQMEYWYSVETTDEDLSFAYILESKINKAARQEISWCYQYMGNRRKIIENASRNLESDGDRRLVIMSINSGPVDKPMLDIFCPQDKVNEENFCVVFQGKSTIFSHESDDVSIMADSMRAGIEEAMANDSLLDPETLPSVVKVTYLGDSETAVTTYGGRAEVEDVSKAVGSEVDDKKGFVPAVTASFFVASIVAIVILLALLLFVKRRRHLAAQRELEAGAAVLAASGSDESGDPADAFHQGYYHYTKDGVRYLSPYCQTCRETELQLRNGVGLETISEDEEFREGRLRSLVAADSQDLGLKHSTQDVRGCKSSLCASCSPRSSEDSPRPEVNFVSSTSPGTFPNNSAHSPLSSREASHFSFSAMVPSYREGSDVGFEVQSPLATSPRNGSSAEV